MVKDAQLELVNANIIESNMLIQLMSEQSCKDSNTPINMSLLHAAGVKVTRGNVSSVAVEKMHFFHIDTVVLMKRRHLAADEIPTVHLGMSDQEVKR